MILIINYYNSPHFERSKELNYSFQRNIESKLFDKIVCFITPEVQIPINLQDEVVDLVQVNNRPTYKDFIEYCQKNFNNEICVLANLDMFYDDTIKLAKEINFDKYIICLSRWEFNMKDGSSKRRSDEICSFSKDTWIFNSNQKFDNINEMDFLIGIPKCDTRISKLFSLNYEVINPCDSIISFHCHESGLRNYQCGRDFIKGEVLYVPPISLKDIE